MKTTKRPSKRSSTVDGAPGRSAEPHYFSSQVWASSRFYLKVRPGYSRDLMVISGGCEHCRLDYEIKRKGFPFPILEFVAKGAGRLVLQEREWELRPGSVFVYGRGIAHRIIADPKRAMTKYFVAFSGQAARHLLKECHILPDRIMHVTHPERVQQVFDDLIRHGLGDSINRERMCAVALQYLMMIITDCAVSEGRASAPAYVTYQRCRKFLEENCVRLRSLQEAADSCHVNVAYLCRLFQRFGRQSPFQYLQHLRMNHAAGLLQTSNRMVKEVAEELGFTDPYNFSRTFRRVFGVYPGQLHNRGKTASD